jgi:hypothetical protein
MSQLDALDGRGECRRGEEKANKTKHGYSITLIFTFRYHTGACALPWSP